MNENYPVPTNWKLYTDNNEAWDSVLNDCAKAERSIDLEQFIFVPDDFGQKLIKVCIERASKGVQIRFLWDAAGSFNIKGSNLSEELKKKGIQLLFWKTLIPQYSTYQNFRSWYLRNHRRTLVIDGKIGYTGSICIEDKIKNWRDTNVRLEGAVVAEMQTAFQRMWNRASKKYSKIIESAERDTEFSYLTNNPSPGKRYLYRTLIEAIRSAQKYLYITTPYFVPSGKLVRVLKLAAHRGVDVRILIPKKTDHYPTLDMAARSYFTTMFESGIRIFLYHGNMIHSKTVVIDGEWATVGSLNMDNASLLYNYEANIVTTNRKFAEEIRDHFLRDTSESHEQTAEDWKNRFFIEKVPEVLIKLVRKFL